MGMTSGATKSGEVVLDVKGLLLRIDRLQGDLVEFVTSAIQEGVEPDKHFAQADQHLKSAISLDRREDVHACIIKARRAIGAGLDARMAGDALMSLRGRLREYQRSSESLMSECDHVIEAQAKVRHARLSVAPEPWKPWPWRSWERFSRWWDGRGVHSCGETLEIRIPYKGASGERREGRFQVGTDPDREDSETTGGTESEEARESRLVKSAIGYVGDNGPMFLKFCWCAMRDIGPDRFSECLSQFMKLALTCGGAKRQGRRVFAALVKSKKDSFRITRCRDRRKVVFRGKAKESDSNTASNIDAGVDQDGVDIRAHFKKESAHDD